MKGIKPLKNESGTILVISLIILALASMIGIAATMTASLELQVSGNDMRHAENFYRAEAAAMVGAQAIEASTDELPNGQYTNDGEDFKLPSIDKTGQSSGLPDPDNISDDTNWDTSGTNKISAEAPDVISDTAAGFEASFLPVEKPAQGASLDMAGTSGTKMHEFVIYGRSILEHSTRKMSQVIIEIGYKKRF